jgi:mono/diheme cytochrome c family protein
MKTTVLLAIAALSLMGLTANAEDGKALFDSECAKCHGADGKGDTKMGKKLNIKDLTDAKVQAEATDEKILKAVKEGIKDGDKTLMKATEKLNDEQIKTVIAYVRTLKK